MSRFALVIATLCTLLLIGVLALLNHFDANPGSTLEQLLTDEDLASLRRSRELFGVESEPVVLAIISPADKPRITRLKSIEKALLEIEGVVSATTGTPVDLDKFVKKQPFTPAPGLGILLLTLESGSRTVQLANEVSSQIEAAARTFLHDDDGLIIVGTPQIRAASWRIAEDDLKVILPLLMLILIIVAVVCFASMTALVLSFLIAAVVTLICLIGQKVVFGEANVLVALMVPVIFSISTLDVFHLYDRTCQKSRQHSPTPALDACRELLLPCFLTTITTAGCFATLALQGTSPLLATFGIWGSAGALLAFALTFSLGTLVLSNQSLVTDRSKWLQKLTLRLVINSQTRPILTVSIWCSALAVSVALLNQLEIRSAFPNIFSNHIGISGDIETLQALTGTDLNPVDVVIRADDEKGKERQALGAAILATSNYLKTLEETQVVLPIDFFSSAQLTEVSGQISDETLGGGVDNTLVSQWVQFDDGAARVQLHLAKTSYTRKQEIFRWLRHFDDTMLSHHKLDLTGTGYFYPLSEHRGVQDLLLSCVLSILLIALTMAWISRRFLVAILALSGSVVPAFLVTIIMVVLDISWTIALLPLPCVLIGLMADDTIHLIWPLRGAKRMRRIHFIRSAVNAAPALLATTMVLAAGMATLSLSGIHTNQQLGLLLPCGLLIAFVYNLSLIPAVSSLWRRSSRHRPP